MLLAILVAVAEPAVEPCTENADDVVALVADRVRRNPGVPIAIRAVAGTPYSGFRDVPMTCVQNIAVEDNRLATWDARRSTLTIDKDTPPGTSVTLRYSVEAETRKLTIDAADPRQAYLNLRLSQKALAGCTGERLGELVLDYDNRFSVTFQPFESYQDYWGRYAYDPTDGRIEMSVEAGNAIEKGADLTGTIMKEADGWTISGVNFGRVRQDSPSGCTYRF